MCTARIKASSLRDHDQLIIIGTLFCGFVSSLSSPIFFCWFELKARGGPWEALESFRYEHATENVLVEILLCHNKAHT